MIYGSVRAWTKVRPVFQAEPYLIGQILQCLLYVVQPICSAKTWGNRTPIPKRLNRLGKDPS